MVKNERREAFGLSLFFFELLGELSLPVALGRNLPTLKGNPSKLKSLSFESPEGLLWAPLNGALFGVPDGRGSEYRVIILFG